MMLTNIIIVASRVVCKVRMRDYFIYHEYLFMFIGSIQYGLSKDDCVVWLVWLLFCPVEVQRFMKATIFESEVTNLKSNSLFGFLFT